MKDLLEGISTNFSKEKLVLMIILYILEIILSAFSLYILALVGQRVVLNLRNKIWRKLLNANVGYFSKNNPSETISRITNDTTVVSSLLSSDITDILSGSVAIIGSVTILFYLDLPMTLVLLGAIPITIFIIIPLSKIIYKVSYNHQEQMAKLTGLLSTRLSEIRLVKSYNAKNIEIANGEHQMSVIYDNNLKKAKVEAVFTPLIASTVTLIIMGVVGFGAYRVGQGYLSSGELLAFILYLFQIIGPIGLISNFVTNYQSAKGATKRIFEILDMNVEENSGLLSPIFGELEFKKVYFKYEEELILKDVNFKIKPNTTNAIVGVSGSGKTTIFYLIERFFNPNKGTILLNGIDHKSTDLEEWRKMFSYVSQDCPIIVGSVRENITYGIDEKISEEKVVEVSKLANCHEFIKKLPYGYDTILNERGIDLSGGQRQRISIARALLRDSPFLLLDESTSSLDTDSERKIQSAIQRLSSDKTTIVIAHRISTIMNSDQIIVLNNGEVLETGKHEELIEKLPLYKNLANQDTKIKDRLEKTS